jgi:hypothetical protein
MMSGWKPRNLEPARVAGCRRQEEGLQAPGALAGRREVIRLLSVDHSGRAAIRLSVGHL